MVVSLPSEVIVHPLVLLSVVDHYNRIAKDTSKRVVGVLLGETYKGRVDVSNSFAVPFEEDAKDPNIWYLDHSFLESMFHMFRKVNAKERIVGFYSTGPKIRSNDIKIDAVFRKHCTNPVLVIVDIRPDIQGVPTQAYYSVEEVDDSKETSRTFRFLESKVEAYEAEEVGVEHLLRDINDPTISTLQSRIHHKLGGLRELRSKLEEMHAYLIAVDKGDLPVNNQIVYNLQDIFNLLPNLNMETLIKSFFVKTNDMHLVVYLSTLIRSIIALHNLLNNKLEYKDYESKKNQVKISSSENDIEKKKVESDKSKSS